MKCPFCGELEDRVVDSRSTADGEKIRRRRECGVCGERYTTYERVEEMFPRVVKSDGSREEYAREKVRRGIELAAKKRPVSVDEIEEVVDQIESQLVDSPEREVSSDWIGSAVTEELKSLDPVAYIRFASVYRAFSEIHEFLAEVREFDDEPNARESSSGE